ncbi:MAG: hypothetical protein QOK29_3845 [Rhodospirillaceae bacterium]|jgi:hypothetical protein|nr:hypothetical protein [Rhodospirillaceae bacterium]
MASGKLFRSILLIQHRRTSGGIAKRKDTDACVTAHENGGPVDPEAAKAADATGVLETEPLTRYQDLADPSNREDVRK